MFCTHQNKFLSVIERKWSFSLVITRKVKMCLFSVFKHWKDVNFETFTTSDFWHECIPDKFLRVWAFSSWVSSWPHSFWRLLMSHAAALVVCHDPQPEPEPDLRLHLSLPLCLHDLYSHPVSALCAPPAQYAIIFLEFKASSCRCLTFIFFTLPKLAIFRLRPQATFEEAFQPPRKLQELKRC